MNVFETVKMAVTVPEAANAYGLKANRYQMVCCPFHNDRHPSMKLNERYFYCFGCGTGGDVIELTARLFAIGNYEAARKLANDFGITIGGDGAGPQIAAEMSEYMRKRELERQQRKQEAFCQRVMCEYLHLLQEWLEHEKPLLSDTSGENWSEHFLEACQMRSVAENLADVLTFGDAQQRRNVAERLSKDGTVADLHQRIERIRGEER